MFSLASITTLDDTYSALLSDDNGTFALMHKNEIIDEWKAT